MEQIKVYYRSNAVNVYHRPGKTNEKIVFIHGGGLDSAMLSWEEVIGLLDSRYDVCTIDQLGYGESDKPNIEYTIPLYIDCLHDVLSQLHIEKAHFAGLSLGGGVCIGFALKYPQLVDRLILVDAFGYYELMPLHRLCWHFVNSRFNLKSYEWMGKSKGTIRWVTASSLIGDKSKITDELVEKLYALVNEPGCSMAFNSLQRNELLKDKMATGLAQRLCELRMPVLLVNGEKDKAVPAKSAAAAAKTIKNSRLYIMKGCKHWAQKERPEEFVHVMENFLKSGKAAETINESV